MRTDILNRKDEIISYIDNGYTLQKICLILKCKHTTLKKYLKILEINYVTKQIPWNKGLKKETDERLKLKGENLSRAYKDGKIKSSNKNKKMSKEQKIKLSEIRQNLLRNNESNCKWYEVKDHNGNTILVQGTWEKRVAEKLNKLNIRWERGKKLQYCEVHFYTPDFYLPDYNIFLEIKGWWKYYDLLKMENVLIEHVIDIRVIEKLKDIKNFENDKLQIEDIKRMMINEEPWITLIKEAKNKDYTRKEKKITTLDKIRKILEERPMINLKDISDELRLTIKTIRKYYKILGILKKSKEYHNAVRFNWEESQKHYIPLILNSNIDFSKFGWVEKISKILNCPPQKVNKWMKRIMPEFYEKNCFKRKIGIKGVNNKSKITRKEWNKNIENDILNKIVIIKNSNINFSERGWGKKVANLLGISKKSAYRWMKKNFKISNN